MHEAIRYRVKFCHAVAGLFEHQCTMVHTNGARNCFNVYIPQLSLFRQRSERSETFLELRRMYLQVHPLHISPVPLMTASR